MDTERLRVKVGMGLHLQLFIDATVDNLKRGEELDGLCEEYVSNLSLIKRLAQECISRLPILPNLSASSILTYPEKIRTLYVQK